MILGEVSISLHVSSEKVDKRWSMYWTGAKHEIEQVDEVIIDNFMNTCWINYLSNSEKILASVFWKHLGSCWQFRLRCSKTLHVTTPPQKKMSKKNQKRCVGLRQSASLRLCEVTCLFQLDLVRTLIIYTRCTAGQVQWTVMSVRAQPETSGFLPFNTVLLWEKKIPFAFFAKNLCNIFSFAAVCVLVSFQRYQRPT